MSLLQDWRDVAYNQETDKNELQKFWADYFLVEKGIYEKLLASPDEEVRGTVKELADKYEIDLMHMVGFLDGINDSLKVPNPIEEMEKNTEVSLELIRNCCTRIWWMPRQTGSMSFPPGKRSSLRRRGKNYIWNRKNTAPS